MQAACATCAEHRNTHAVTSKRVAGPPSITGNNRDRVQVAVPAALVGFVDAVLIAAAGWRALGARP
jgi:hypothetical protein